MGLTPDVRLIHRRDITMRALGDGAAVLVDMKSGKCFELNRTGVEVWELLAGGATVRSICTTLATRYGIQPEIVMVDVQAIIGLLQQEQLIERVPSASNDT